VRQFCQERGIAYCETGLRQSFIDILQALRAVSAEVAASPAA
ncbi:MAG: acyl-CoA desaturase, partial [Chloroflexi bacterium]|nr:acyl-CoA desaturase [Chloroflexota bacterium]